VLELYFPRTSTEPQLKERGRMQGTKQKEREYKRNKRAASAHDAVTNSANESVKISFGEEAHPRRRRPRSITDRE